MIKKFFYSLGQYLSITKDNPEMRPARVYRVVRAFGSGRYKKFRTKALRNKNFVGLLQRETTLPTILGDWRNTLKDMPEGSFGKAYYDFMQEEEVDYAKFIDAYNESGHSFSDPLHQAYDERERDLHDIIHVVCGYYRTRWSEGCVVATHYWQGGSTGLMAIIVFGGLRILRRRPSFVFGYVKGMFDVYWRQRKADLRCYPWEDNLDKPLEEIREELGISGKTHRMKLNEWISRKAGWTDQGLAA